MATEYFKCPNCGARHKSFFNAARHEKQCKPPAPPEPPQESVKHYMTRMFY